MKVGPLHGELVWMIFFLCCCFSSLLWYTRFVSPSRHHLVSSISLSLFLLHPLYSLWYLVPLIYACFLYSPLPYTIITEPYPDLSTWPFSFLRTLLYSWRRMSEPLTSLSTAPPFLKFVRKAIDNWEKGDGTVIHGCLRHFFAERRSAGSLTRSFLMRSLAAYHKKGGK